MVARTIDRDLLEKTEPVLGTPSTGVGRVHGDDRETGVGGHLDQAITEPGRRETRHHGERDKPWEATWSVVWCQ